MDQDEVYVSEFEEQLTEEHLAKRIEAAFKLESKVSKLHYKDQLDKATLPQAAAWEDVVKYFQIEQEIAELVLYVKSIDRGSPSGRFAYSGRTKEEALDELRSIRSELRPLKLYFCGALRAFGITEDNEFWPFKGLDKLNSSVAKRIEDGDDSSSQSASSLTSEMIGSVSIEQWSPYQRKIAGVLVGEDFDLRPEEVAKRIPIGFRFFPESFRAEIDFQTMKTLSDLLKLNSILLRRFGNSVSEVRSKLRKLMVDDSK